MKQTLSKFLAVIMVLSIAMGLAACSDSKQSENKNEDNKAASTATTTATTTVTTAATTAKPANNKASYVGKWKGVSASSEGLTLDLATIGLDMTIELKEDGTAVIHLSGDDNKGTGKWEMTDTGIKLSEGGENVDVKLVDGKLAIEEDGATILFEKQ